MGSRESLHAPLRYAAVLSVGESFTLDANLLRSLRFREVNVREAFTIRDSVGNFFRASLKTTTDGTGEAIAYERMATPPESPTRITLLTAVLSRQKMLVVVQKSTELGCVRIVPVLSDHSVTVADLQKEKPWAWQGQALKASRQCRRASVPVLMPPTPLREAIAMAFWKEASTRFVLDDEVSDAPTNLSFAAGAASPLALVLAVGPEGGWSAEERALFRETGATVLRLGSRVLRAETAVFAGLSVLQHRFGDLGPEPPR